ncbi:MAG: TadE/TadG family type IV pilus assembly protein [Pseudomonadota bacterium]
MIKSLKRFLKAKAGSVATVTGIMILPLLGVVAYAVDYSIMFHQRLKLQDIADSAAMASVKELSLSGANEDVIKKVARSYALDTLGDKWQISAADSDLDVKVTPSKREGKVSVDLSYVWQPFIAHLFDDRVNPIQVSSTADLAGESLTCIIGLMQPQRLAKSSIHIDNNAVVRADNCSVFSNSVHKYGLRADKSAQMTAETICSAGGVLTMGRKKQAQFSPKPITDCPKIDDPLENRRYPKYGACKEKSLVVTEDKMIKPSVYCGGLTIGGDAEVELQAGVYIIKDGPLIVKDSASLKGKGVTFFLTGADSTFDFQENTTIDLAAAETGVTAGLLFFEDRSVPHSFKFNPFNYKSRSKDVRIHSISSNDARNLLGTLYLSKSILMIDADAPVADASAYTAIITARLWLREGPVLTLNADLTDTQVPVPNGLIGKEARLVK